MRAGTQGSLDAVGINHPSEEHAADAGVFADVGLLMTQTEATRHLYRGRQRCHVQLVRPVGAEVFQSSGLEGLQAGDQIIHVADVDIVVAGRRLRPVLASATIRRPEGDIAGVIEVNATVPLHDGVVPTIRLVDLEPVILRLRRVLFPHARSLA